MNARKAKKLRRRAEGYAGAYKGPRKPQWTMRAKAPQTAYLRYPEGHPRRVYQDSKKVP